MTNTNYTVPTMSALKAKNESPEVLLWIGCAGSYDERYKKVIKAFVNILRTIGIKFATLGAEETCTGDPARRAGNEFLFQMQAFKNIKLMNKYEVKKIVTACPHCFNTIKNEYPELGGKYHVIHHATFLQQLIDEGKIRIKENSNFKGKKVTYHDSCYLGRANGVYEAPRALLKALDADLIEMKRCRANGLCCGAGGAQLFKEPEQGSKSINSERAEEVANTGASTVAVACPFCMTMMSDGVKEQSDTAKIEVKDIAELIAEAQDIQQK